MKQTDAADNMVSATTDIFNRWVEGLSLPDGTYTHEQLRRMLQLAWTAGVEIMAIVFTEVVEEAKAKRDGRQHSD